MEQEEKLPNLANVEQEPLGVQNPINIPLIYTNGLLVTMTVTDLQLTATVNGKPQCLLVLPLSAGKSLMASLQKALNDYERRTGIKIVELDVLNKQFNQKN